MKLIDKEAIARRANLIATLMGKHACVYDLEVCQETFDDDAKSMLWAAIASINGPEIELKNSDVYAIAVKAEALIREELEKLR